MNNQRAHHPSFDKFCELVGKAMLVGLGIVVLLAVMVVW